jgi:hypothetical protein
MTEAGALMNKRIVGSSLILGLAGLSLAQLPGRLVYTQIGANAGGAETIGSTGNTIQFLTIARTGTGQTPLPLGFVPNIAGGAVFHGGATGENGITRSSNGRFVFISGYAGPIGTTLPGTPATVNRVLGRLDFTGNFDLSTRLTDSFSGQSIRGSVMSEAPVSGSYRMWAVGGNDGVRTTTFGATASTVVSTTTTNLRTIDTVNGDLIIATGSGTVGLRRIAGLPTSSGNAMTELVRTSTGNTFNHTSPYGFAFTGNASAGGTLDVYISDDSSANPGVYKYRSLNGIAGPFSQLYRLTTTGVRSLAFDGQVLYGVTGLQGGANNNNQIVAIWDGGSAGSSFTQPLIAAVGATNWIRTIALAAEPAVVDNDYRSTSTAGNVMSLRTSNGAQRAVRVGLVPDSDSRSWTDLGTVNYSGQAVKTALNAAGDTFVLVQGAADGGGSTIVPTVSVSRVPAAGGASVASSVQNIPAGYEAFAITVDSSGRPVVACRPAAGAPDVRFVRWSADLATATVFDNGGTGFSSGGKTPIDIATDPANYIRTVFANGAALSTTGFDTTFTAGAATADVTIATDGGDVMAPLSAQYGADGNLRVLSVGATPLTRARLRVDTLDAANTAVATTGTGYRRDAVGGATAPAFMWAFGLSMGGNQPRVLMVSTSEPTTGPSGPGVGTANRNDQILGSGRVWTFDAANAVSSSSYRFIPGFAPVN